jgi:Ca2+-binding RTX toxin-like protein
VLINLDADADSDADVSMVGEGEIGLDGAGGDDELVGVGGGGTGPDPASHLKLRGGEGDDVLVAGGRRNIILPGAGSDTVDASPFRRDIVSYEDAPGPVRANLGTGVVAADGFGSEDSLDPDARGIRTGDSADRVTAGGVSPAFTGGVTVESGRGDDVVLGGPDADRVLAGRGDDRVDADPGSSRGGDTIDGGSDDDTLHGSTHADTLRGGSGDDILIGRGGVARSYGPLLPGGDSLEGGPGSDYLDGGRGPDDYVFAATEHHEVDTIAEAPGQGRDTVTFSYYDTMYENLPILDSAVNLSSRGRKFGTDGGRTLRTLADGGAREIENAIDESPSSARFVGNESANLLVVGGYEGSVDCRGGPDRATVPWDVGVRNCEKVKRVDPWY